MGELLAFGRSVKPGDVIKAAGCYYLLSRVDGFSLFGYRALGPKAEMHYGDERHIVDDYRRTRFKREDGSVCNFPIIHSDGIPVL